MGSSTEDNNSMQHVSVEIPSDVVAKKKTYVLHRVPPQVRENKAYIYDPVVLSIGPYHRSDGPRFRQTERLKDEVLDTMLDSNVKDLFRCKILERVDEIRNFYGGLPKDEHDDDALTQMMLRDATFILYYILMDTDDDYDKYSHCVHRLGEFGVSFMFRDVFMLENQIPFWLIKLIINLKTSDDEGEVLLLRFLGNMNFGNQSTLTRLPWKEGDEPVHLLDTHRKTLVKEESSADVEEAVVKNQRCGFLKFKWRWRSGSRPSSSTVCFEANSSPFRSVTDLKSKGVHFRPSSNCLTDIRFTSYSFYAKLELPIWFVTNNSKVFFSNTIALEMSPEREAEDTDHLAVTSYVNFMKTLIENSNDVKELREKRILFSCLPSDEEVVQMFKDIDTYGQIQDIHQEIQMRINEHCGSKSKTWMAELIHTYFRSPWTAIALFAATFLLCLTFLQTYFTISPP